MVRYIEGSRIFKGSMPLYMTADRFLIYEENQCSARQWKDVSKRVLACCTHYQHCSSFIDKDYVKAGVQEATTLFLVERTEVNAMTGRDHEMCVGFSTVTVEAYVTHISVIFAMKAGEALIHEIREWSRKKACVKITLDATIPAFRFYLRVGFVLFDHRNPRGTKVKKSVQSRVVKIFDEWCNTDTIDFDSEVEPVLTDLGVWNSENKTFYMTIGV